MSGSSLAFMVLIGGFVWGGFLLCVGAMMRAERRKSGSPPGGAS